MNPARKNIKNSIIILMAFVISFYGKRISDLFIPLHFSNRFLQIGYYYLWWVLPSGFILGMLNGFKKIPESSGLSRGLKKGLLFSIAAVSPMILGSLLFGRINDHIDIFDLMHKTFFAGFFEEYLFRGFLFGILFRKLKWGFIPASVLSGVLFASGHLYQSHSPADAIGITVVTTMGAMWFSWLYIEWNNNLWVPVFLHSLMNGAWILFDMSDNALGGLIENIFRLTTILITIAITLYYHRRKGLTIRGNNLFINKSGS